MKKTIHHEILLFTGTSLAGRQLTGNEQIHNGKKYSTADELEMACWNGILFEIFPGMPGIALANNQFIWHVLTGKNFVYVSIGPFPVIADHDSSIDPYFFMTNDREN